MWYAVCHNWLSYNVSVVFKVCRNPRGDETRKANILKHSDWIPCASRQDLRRVDCNRSKDGNLTIQMEPVALKEVRLQSVLPQEFHEFLPKITVFGCGLKWTQWNRFLLVSLMLSIFWSITSFGTILGRSLLILNFIGPAGSARAYQFAAAQLRMDNLLCNPYLTWLEYSLEGVAGKDLQFLP